MTVSNGTIHTVTLRIHRFSPLADGDQNHGSSPFGSRSGRRSNPFGRIEDASSDTRTRTRASSPFGRKANDDSTERPPHTGSPFDRTTRHRTGSPFGDTSDQTDATASLKARHPRIRGRKRVEDYVVRARSTDTLLDCLLTIKRTIDPTLSFRYSCGHGVCGSDAVAVNGIPTLLCTATVGEFAKPNGANDSAVFRHSAVSNAHATSNRGITSRTAAVDSHVNGAEASSGIPSSEQTLTTNTSSAHVTQDVHGSATSGNLTKSVTVPPETDLETAATSSLGVVELAPLPGFPVVRDLIVDIAQMMDQIKALSPYLRADGKLATTTDGKIDMFEYLQSLEELKRIELLSNCISCGVCEGSCPVYAGGEAFVGPAALVSASRFINDSRDTATAERLEEIASQDGIAACQSVRACSRRCPRGIDVGEEMWRLTERVNAR